MHAAQHTAAARRLPCLTFSVWLMTGVAAFADTASQPYKMNTFVEIRIANQRLPDALKAIAAAANVDVKASEQLNEVNISDWKASGALHEVLDAFSKEYALCMHYDGMKLDITPASSASLEVVSIAGDAEQAKRQFRFAIPWSSSNAVTYDKTGQLAKVCGSSGIVETTKRYFGSPNRKSINIIRYAIPSN